MLRLSMLAIAVVATGSASAIAAPTPKRLAPPVSPRIIPLPLKQIIAENQRACTSKSPSGLGYATLRAGNGAKPLASNAVKVNYIGYLSSTGAVFDQGMGVGFPVNRVIKGFSEGLQMMQPGAIMRFCIPASLGYGARSTGGIPANSDLTFQVELLSIDQAQSGAE